MFCRPHLLHVLLMLLPFQVFGWTAPPAQKTSSTNTDAVDSAAKPLNRATFLSTTATAATAALTTLILPVTLTATPATAAAAAAAAVDPSLKGTKKDPAFEACLSKCMYECTKPKGAEQKTRQECLPECKQSCATTKEQLMKGTPIKK